MQEWAVPGLSPAVARNGQLRAAHCFGYANRTVVAGELDALMWQGQAVA